MRNSCFVVSLLYLTSDFSFPDDNESDEPALFQVAVIIDAYDTGSSRCHCTYGVAGVRPRERERELLDLTQEEFWGHEPDPEQAAAGPVGNDYGLVVSYRRGNKNKSNGRERRTQGKEATGKAAPEGARDRDAQDANFVCLFVCLLMHHGCSK